MLQNYLNALFGLAVFSVAFMGLTSVGVAWTLGILGAATFIVGIWGGIVDSSVDYKNPDYKKYKQA
jgi:hypothetical protein